MNKRNFLSTCLCVISFTFYAQPVSLPELIRVPYVSNVDQKEHDFYLYLPAGYHSTPDRKWPIMLFLHGNGERGDGKADLDWVLKEGTLYEAWIQKRNLPFIIISPQLPMMGDTVEDYIKFRDKSLLPSQLETGVPPRPQPFEVPFKMNGQAPVESIRENEFPLGWEVVEQDLIEMVILIQNTYRGDQAKTYLTGLSYGGHGTWYMASKYPDLWAAINPIVAFAHPDLMNTIAEHKIPIWAFAGGRDEGKPVKYFYPALNRLEALGHTDVRFTIEADMGHDAWRRVYAGEDLYTWFLSHHKN
ncbi:MAG: alpha/beta hydrolase [Bacteroidota bacterium]|nr:alpha/beta hydrolase [Bacteroidota bacterium]